MSGIDEAAIDRHDADTASRSSAVDRPPPDPMRQELLAVLSAPDFSRAPIMKRLLSFLVEETAAGRGDQLKAYSVAVDGLGRAPDYDARADSYPRVQVGRLRRMLDTHYAATRPAGGLRLTIPSGRYRVVMEPADGLAVADQQAAATGGQPTRPMAFLLSVLALILLVAGAAILAIQLLPDRAMAPVAPRDRPILELDGTTMARGSPFGNMIRASLINGLGRSDIYDLRPMRRSGVADPHAVTPRYRLGADLVEGPTPRLFLRLSMVGPDRLIWSGDVSFPQGERPDAVAIDTALAPLIASVGKVNGLIAIHELQANDGRKAVGYSCILLYHRYRKERSTGELENVEACIERSLRADPGNADLQAAAAHLAIERMASSTADARQRPALLATARRHAQLAAQIDPFNPWTNAARARVALARGSCAQTINFATRASQLQPYDPVLLADTGLYMVDCDDDRAEALIRRAIAIGDDPEGRFYSPLLLLAIGRGDHALAREALAQMAPPVVGQHSRFYLISAAGYAMLGDLPHARAAWRQLKTINAAIARDPHGYLERLGYAGTLNAKLLGHLRRARLTQS